MPYPSILFFTRGRGRGHAIPDLIIAEKLRGLRRDLDLRFASYSTGAATLAEHGETVVDLHLPDDPPFLDLVVAATATIAKHQPALVVSHEDFAVLPAARGLGHSPLFVVDFFPQHELSRQSLRHADQILFIEQRGMFGEPPEAQGKVQYLGPVFRPLSVSRADRLRARQELGLAAAASVVSVIPGAWATEARAPIAALVLPAFRALSGPDKTLVWIAGPDQAEIGRAAGGGEDVRVWARCPAIEKLMVASDVVITKANRGTTIDLARLAVPSISLSHGLNPIDERIIARLHTNLLLHARGIDPPLLTGVLEQAIAASHAGVELGPSPLYATCASDAVARQILRLLPT
jgi:hypothetical protein